MINNSNLTLFVGAEYVVNTVLLCLVLDIRLFAARHILSGSVIAGRITFC